MPNLHPRTCRQCGTTFEGGPRAWYCPICSEVRRKEADRAGHARMRRGETRQIGSMDTCQICGKEYMVMSGKQKYCPTCAPEAVAEIDRTQGLNYYTANADTINPARNEKRRRGPRPCVICGELFDTPTPRKICDKDECSKELKRQYQQRADAKRSPRKRGVEDMESQTAKPTRGGARPGAGRPARPTERKLVRLTPEESAAVEGYASADGVSVHAWMVAAIRAALQTRAGDR